MVFVYAEGAEEVEGEKEEVVEEEIDGWLAACRSFDQASFWTVMRELVGAVKIRGEEATEDAGQGEGGRSL